MISTILFTDIVGYTQMMSIDEEITINLLRINRRIHKRIIKKYHGKWCKEMGDGTLAAFKTISEAVYCAGEILIACRQEHINLRIGIHQGEIIKDNGDIFGDTVNLASRLQTIASPGDILVSKIVNRAAKNRPGIRSNFVMEKKLKHIDEPIRIYRLSVENLSNAEIKINDLISRKYKKIMFNAAAMLILFLSSQFLVHLFLMPYLIQPM